MPRRMCDSCGKERDVSGGRTCENGHFICKECVYPSGFSALISGPRNQCPLCKKYLR